MATSKESALPVCHWPFKVMPLAPLTTPRCPASAKSEQHGQCSPTPRLVCLRVIAEQMPKCSNEREFTVLVASPEPAMI